MTDRRARNGGKRAVRAGLLAGVVVAGALLGACASPRDSLGPTESACYEAIPVAARLAPEGAHLAGVRYLTLDRLHRALEPPPKRALALAGAVAFSLVGPVSACVVAYRGSFTSSLDKHASGPSAGHYLLVVVGLRHATVLEALVVAREPFRLARLLPSSH